MFSSTYMGFFSPPDSGPSAPPPGSTGGGAVPADVERLYKNHDIWADLPSNRSGGRITWYCPHYRLNDIIEATYGVVSDYPSIWGGLVSRRLPMPHPDFPGLYASRFRPQGMGKTSPDGRLYSWYEYEVEFEALPYGTGSDTPFMSIRRDFGLRNMTHKGRTLRMASDDYRLTTNQSAPIPTLVYVVTLYGVSAANVAAVNAASAAPINSTTLYLPGVTVAPGFAMFRGMADQEDRTFAGQVTKTASLKIEAQELLRWDQCFHEVSGEPDVIINPDGSPITASSNLNLLFL